MEEIDTCKFEKAFPDVPGNAWFAKYICVARNHGIIKGYEDGKFKPMNEINFAEASKIVVNAYKLDIVGKSDGKHWYLPYVDALYLKAAVPMTITDYNLPITRGEMADVIFGIENEQGGNGDSSAKTILKPKDTADDSAADDGAADDSAAEDSSAAADPENGNSDSSVSDSAGKYTPEYMKTLITDCSKVMIKEDELPKGYTITGYEVYRGGGTNDNFADCYQYIDYQGRKPDEFPVTVRYLVAESEKVTHEQMNIIANQMPSWEWAEQCERYIGGKLSYYVESKIFFLGGPLSKEKTIANVLYDRAWEMTDTYAGSQNGSNCGSAAMDGISYSPPDDEVCKFVAEDLASGEFEGWVFFDYSGKLREDKCYQEVPEALIKGRLQTYYGNDYMKAWNFFHDDYKRKKLTLVTYQEEGWFHRDEFKSAKIDKNVYIK